LAISHEEKDANQLAQSSGWQTLVAIMRESDHSSIPNGGQTYPGSSSGSSSGVSEWRCRHCTFANKVRNNNCEMCALPRD